MTAKQESTLRARIVQALRARGWLPLVQHGDAWTGPGRSDLLVCAAGRFVALEIKTATGAATEKQKHFLRSVRRAGGGAYVVRSPTQAVQSIDYIVGGHMDPEDAPLDFDLDSLLADLVTPETASPVSNADYGVDPQPIRRQLDDDLPSINGNGEAVVPAPKRRGRPPKSGLTQTAAPEREPAQPAVPTPQRGPQSQAVLEHTGQQVVERLDQIAENIGNLATLVRETLEVLQVIARAKGGE